MNQYLTSLQSVPAINTQELLFHLAAHFPDETLKISTAAGFTYTGRLISISKVRNDEVVLALQITNEQNTLTNNCLHLPIHKIESVELINPADLIHVLSLGKKVKEESYEASGKLEVQRTVQQFSTAIADVHAVNIGIPAITLPTDGLQLNRILKLTQKIQQVIIDLLKEEDARNSWKARYNKIAFINKDTTDVKGVNDTIEIYFPFENIHAPEIAAGELTNQLLAIL